MNRHMHQSQQQDIQTPVSFICSIGKATFVSVFCSLISAGNSFKGPPFSGISCTGFPHEVIICGAEYVRNTSRIHLTCTDCDSWVRQCVHNWIWIQCRHSDAVCVHFWEIKKRLYSPWNFILDVSIGGLCVGKRKKSSRTLWTILEQIQTKSWWHVWNVPRVDCNGHNRLKWQHWETQKLPWDLSYKRQCTGFPAYLTGRREVRYHTFRVFALTA